MKFLFVVLWGLYIDTDAAATFMKMLSAHPAPCIV